MKAHERTKNPTVKARYRASIVHLRCWSTRLAQRVHQREALPTGREGATSPSRCAGRGWDGMPPAPVTAGPSDRCGEVRRLEVSSSDASRPSRPSLQTAHTYPKPTPSHTSTPGMSSVCIGRSHRGAAASSNRRLMPRVMSPSARGVPAKEAGIRRRFAVGRRGRRTLQQAGVQFARLAMRAAAIRVAASSGRCDPAWCRVRSRRDRVPRCGRGPPPRPG